MPPPVISKFPLRNAADTAGEPRPLAYILLQIWDVIRRFFDWPVRPAVHPSAHDPWFTLSPRARNNAWLQLRIAGLNLRRMLEGRDSVRSQLSGWASGIELVRVAKGNCIAEVDDEVSVSESGHQDAVRPLTPSPLDHSVDRRSNAAIHGGPVADPDFDGFRILHVHDVLTSLGRIGRAAWSCASHIGFEVRRPWLPVRGRP